MDSKEERLGITDTNLNNIKISDFSNIVNNELNSVVDNINKNAQIMIDAGLPELVGNHFEVRYHEDREPDYDYDETNLWNIVSHKYLAKYDIPNQALWEKYKAMDVLHEKNLEAFNKIEKPSKLNIVGRYLYHRKEKKLKSEEISAENALEEFRVSDHKLEERIMNLNQVNDKDVYALYDKMQAAMYAYSSLKEFKEKPLVDMKEILGKIENKELYLKGNFTDRGGILINFTNIEDIVKQADFIKSQLVVLARKEAFSNLEKISPSIPVENRLDALSNKYKNGGCTSVENAYCKAFFDRDQYINSNDKNDLAMRAECAVRSLVLSGEYSEAKIVSTAVKLSPLKESAENIKNILKDIKANPNFKIEQRKYVQEHKNSYER